MTMTLGRTTLELLIKEGWEQFASAVAYPVDRIERKSVIAGTGVHPYNFIYNPGRENRPNANGNGATPAPAERSLLCPICANNLCECDLEQAKIITQHDDWYVTINTYPIFKHHVVLVHNQLCPNPRPQGEVSASDLESMACYAQDANQLVFYNSPGAGASIAHHHFQAVSHYDSPLRDMRRTTLTPRVHAKREMGIANYWSHSPHLISMLSNGFKSQDKGFNIIILPNGTPEIGIVPRNKAREVGAHLGSRIAGLELNRGIVVSKAANYAALTYAGIDDDITQACFAPEEIDPYVRKVGR